MEQITRHIVKVRNKVEIDYAFTTFDFILADNLEERVKKFHPNVYLLCEHIRTAFKIGMPRLEMSASGAKTLALKCERLQGHEFTAMALASEAKGKGNMQHPTVQNYFMKNHKHAIAMELPVWDEGMTALLDLVLIDPKTGIVRILDYKPNAAQEKHASTQIWHGARLLARDTTIDPSFIEAYYFDDLNTYKLLNP